VQPVREIALSPAEAGRTGGSRAAERFDAIFREHYPRVVAMLARLTGDRGQAEEIAADSFCKLSRHGMTGDDLAVDNAAPWLYRVAMNAGLDAVRGNARRKARERAAQAESLRAAVPGGALEEMLRVERCARVQAVLAALKPRDAQMLLLRADGLAYRELAQTLGVQPGSVGTLLARAEAEFERKYRARYGDQL
jgi:RNA polymerase sigma-70 factor (ECF subfamily)